jgi:hypothetical protein
MTGRLPAEATRTLEEGVLCYLAARVAGRPHCTPLVYVLDGGRLWVTTARSSAKARGWRSDPSVAGMVRGAEDVVAFRGRVRTYDAMDPTSWPAATIRGPRLARAAARYSVKNARFFAGYAVDAHRVPLAWSPPGRVFVEVELTAGRLLRQNGTVGAGWGAWPGGAGYRGGYRALPRRRPLDRRVPAEVRGSLGSEGEGALAVEANGCLTALPARWRRSGGEGAFEAVTPAAFAELTGGSGEDPASLTIDRASAWRASEMRGILVQGTGRAFAPEATVQGRASLRRRLERHDLRRWEGRPVVLVRLRPDRLVWWQGWTSGTVTDG